MNSPSNVADKTGDAAELAMLGTVDRTTQERLGRAKAGQEQWRTSERVIIIVGTFAFVLRGSFYQHVGTYGTRKVQKQKKNK